MKEEKKEYLGILCKFYIIVLLAVLPLYMSDGYYLLGDAKYQLFRNCTLICLGIWVVVEAFSLLSDLWNRLRVDVKLARPKLGTVDIFLLAYGGCVLLSAISSPYDAAWTGYREWYMGAFSQLFFVGIYFFVSRYYSHDRLTIYVGEAAFFAVIIIGLLNRLGLDPLGIFQEFTETAWEYSNLLSTIGNINWFCGYCSVMLALPISGYLYSRKKVKTTVLYVVSVLGLTLLMIQGSDSGLVLAAVAIGCCLIAGIRKTDFFQKGLLLLLGASVGVGVMGCLVKVFDAWNAIPVDSWIYGKMLWSGWPVFAGVAGVILFCFDRLRKKFPDGAVRRCIKVFLGVMLLTVATVAVFVILKWSQGDADAWGSGRGMLWRLAWEGFLQADFGGKLIGAGPDCFAEYLISIGKTPIITQEDHWANALFVNAHNEWLNHLVNIGVLGMAAYAGIFIAAWKRYRGMMLAILMLAMYGVHSLVSFQQVLNAPFLFLMLGICEATWRRKMAVNDLTQE